MGRPTKYNDEMQAKAEEYLVDCPDTVLSNLIWNVRANVNDETTLAKGTTGTTDASGVIEVTGDLGAISDTVYLSVSDSSGTDLGLYKLTVIDTNA